MNLHDWRLRLRALFRRKRAETDLDDELAFHVEMEARKNFAAGLDIDEARRRARLKFGNRTGVAEACRDERRLNPIESLFQDLRYAFRSFLREPIFALTVILTIAVGLGVNIACFTILNAFFLRTFDVRDPHSLYTFHVFGRSASLAEFVELRARNEAFSDVLAYRNFGARVDGRQAAGLLVSGNYFEMLGVGALRGRTLIPDDASAGGREPVMVISDSAWRNWYGGDPGIVGKQVWVHGRRLSIAGVARAGFRGIDDAPVEFWIPVTMLEALEDHAKVSGPVVSVVGRLKPGMSVEEARARLIPWGWGNPRMPARAPELRSRATMVPLDTEIMAGLSPLLAAFVLLLLMACANTANMMLARAAARRHEIAVRIALGAGRARLVRQLFTESLLLALPAAALGFAISRVLLAGAMRGLIAGLPVDASSQVQALLLPADGRVAAFLAATSCAAVLLFGLAPALQSTRGFFGRAARPGRMRNVLVVVQVAACAMLLVLATVLLRFAPAMEPKIAFRSEGVLHMKIAEQARGPVLAALDSDPAVEQVAAVGSHIPWMGRRTRMWGGGGGSAALLLSTASPEFFPALDLPILKGRGFTAEEAAAQAPVAIVSETAAALLWPSQQAIGQSIRLDAEAPALDEQPRHRSVQVIGVVREASRQAFWAPCCVYVPAAARTSGMDLLTRVRGDAGQGLRRIDALLNTTAPGALLEISRLDRQTSRGAFPFRMLGAVSGGLAALAMLLMLTGIYGVVSYAVAQRTKEIGIRMALGGSVTSVAALLARQFTGLASAGLACGLLLAFAEGRIFVSQYPRTDQLWNTLDPLSYAGAIVGVLLVCAIATYLPARRAARIDPLTTLRHD